MELVDDLAAEHAAFDAAVALLDAEGWARRRRRPGVDDPPLRSPTSPTSTSRGRSPRPTPDRFDANPVGLDTRGTYSEVPADELLVMWRRFNALLDAFAGVDPKARPAAGTACSMSARSFLTARLMETWAHGVDVTDALGLPPAACRSGCGTSPTSACATRGWSYACGRQSRRRADVFVSLRSPMGERLTWGDAGAADRVDRRRPGLRLVVTRTPRRRRHRLAGRGRRRRGAGWPSPRSSPATRPRRPGPADVIRRSRRRCRPRRWPIAAHPDDVEFGAGGTLARWPAAGCVVHHLVLTDGSKGTWDPRRRRPRPRHRPPGRAARSAARRLGAPPARCASSDWVDGELES